LIWLVQTRKCTFFAKNTYIVFSYLFNPLAASNNLISEGAAEKGTETRVPSPSVSPASKKKNPPEEPSSKAPRVEAHGKPMAEPSVKRQKNNVQLLDISLEKHQALSSLNDVSCCRCRSFIYSIIF
jgi:hypothetical protein